MPGETTEPVTPTPPAEPTVMPPAEPTTPPAAASADEPLGEGGLKALQAERDARAAAEKALKTATEQLAEFQRQQMSDAEKAIDEAKRETRASVTSEFAQRLASAEIKAALTGIVPDPTAVVGDLNLAKYVTDEGEVNTEEVAKLKERWAAIVGNKPLFEGGGDNGPRTDPPAETLDEQIAAAEAKGDLTTSMRLKAQKLLSPQK